MNRVLLLLVILVASKLAAGSETPVAAPIHYTVSVSAYTEHRLHVSVRFHAGHEPTTFQLPTWYAMYQIRNFAQYLQNPRAFAADGNPLSLRSLDKTTWSVSGHERASRLEYDVVCNLPGPYGLEVDASRITINPALLLIYSPNALKDSAEIEFEGMPSEWKVVSTLPEASHHFIANNYEQLADSLFWLGNFAETQYSEGSTTVRIIVDANVKDYNLDELVQHNQRVVHAEDLWMNGLPVTTYTFFYRFPEEGGGIEGMEHPDGTFISVPANSTRESMSAVDNVTAHEFFHLWNVMRIRPCTLEPVDFVHEQYSPSLWFSEGVTSAASRLLQLQAGYLSERDYLDRLVSTLKDLQASPANSWQSAEDASISVWLVRTPAYDSPERSISYYRKGELLGVLLDLRIRKETNGKKSLRDLFRGLQQTYGAPHRCFQDGKALQAAVEALTKRPEGDFFVKYVSGHDPLPFDDYLRFVGLELDAQGVHDVQASSDEQREQQRAWLNGRDLP
jgi:predicted metalloprotease with PDZ domain